MEKAGFLKAEIREGMGTHATARLRSKGLVPAVVYGHKQEPVTVSLGAHDLLEKLHHGSRVLDIQIGKKKETVIFKEVQYDHLGKNIIHVDLMRVSVTENVKVAVPVELKGIAKGTTEGGVVQEHLNKLEVECKVTDIPEVITVSVKELAVGSSIHAGDIILPEGVKLVSDPKLLVVSCSLLAVAKAAEEEITEEPQAPEVITERKKETEEESSEEK